MFIPDLDFSIPDPASLKHRIRIRNKNLSIFNPNIFVLSSRKYSMIWGVYSGIRTFSIPDPDPESRGQKARDPRSVSAAQFLPFCLPSLFS
jgi:hypothetical protein